MFDSLYMKWNKLCKAISDCICVYWCVFYADIYTINLSNLFAGMGGYEDDSRDPRSRRRLTDDDDTVLDNASVTSQDQGNNIWKILESGFLPIYLQIDGFLRS